MKCIVQPPLNSKKAHKLKQDAGIPYLPTQLTLDCRNALAGKGPMAYTWEDKPHRLIFDLCGELERLSNLLYHEQK